MAGTTSEGSPIGERGTRWAKNRPINGPMQIVGRGGRMAGHRNEENGGGELTPSTYIKSVVFRCGYRQYEKNQGK